MDSVWGNILRTTLMYKLHLHIANICKCIYVILNYAILGILEKNLNGLFRETRKLYKLYRIALQDI